MVWVLAFRYPELAYGLGLGFQVEASGLRRVLC